MNASVPDTAVCLQCGYLLRGLTEARCPECGRGFDPNDRYTFADSRTFSRWRLWTAPPPKWHLLAVIVLTSAILDGCSIAGGPCGIVAVSSGPIALLNCLGPPLLVLLALDYLARVIRVRRDRSTVGGRPGSRPGRGRLRWAVTPVCALLLLSSLFYPWPLYARFALSRPALDRTARAVVAGKSVNTGLQWVGLYRVGKIVQNESPGTVGFVTGMSISDPVGLVYDLNPRPPSRYWYQVAPGWYVENW